MADVPKLGGNTNKTPQAVRRELRMEAGGQVSTDRPGVRDSPSKNEIMDEATKIEISVQELQLEVLEKLNAVATSVLSSTETTAQTMEIIRAQLVDTNTSTAVKKELQRLIEQHIQVLFESAVLGFKVSVSDTFGKVTEYFEQITATIQMAEIEQVSMIPTDEETLAHREYVEIMKQIEKHAAMKHKLEETRKLQIQYQEKEAANHEQAWADNPEAAAKIKLDTETESHIARSDSAIALKITQIRQLLSSNLGCPAPPPYERSLKTLSASDFKGLKDIKLCKMPEDPKKSLKLRELITNVLPRFTYDCWAIIPSVLRLMNLRVHADFWSPPTNDMLEGIDGSYDSEKTGIGIYTRQSYIAHNENLFKLLQQAADDDVSWATEGDRLATDGNSYSRQICGRTGDGLSVLEYWYFRQ